MQRGDQDTHSYTQTHTHAHTYTHTARAGNLKWIMDVAASPLFRPHPLLKKRQRKWKEVQPKGSGAIEENDTLERYGKRPLTDLFGRCLL